MPKFKVTGYAFAPVECAVEVDAPDAQAALTAAKQKFQQSRRKGDFVVANSVDDTHPQEWEPLEAEQI